MGSDGIPRYQQVARAVEQEVLGRGGSKVPSAREVAAAHGVSVVTASRAIQVLRDRGLIRTVERSGSFVTPAPGPETEAHLALVQRSTPGPWLSASLAFTRAGFAAVSRREGLRIDDGRFHFDDTTRTAELRRQARAAAHEGVSGIIFMPSRYSDEAARQDETFLLACREAGMACVLIERNLRGWARRLDYDLVAADDLDGGERCTAHLLQQGRRRVAFITGSPTSSHEGRLAGYLASIARTPGAGPPLVLELPGSDRPGDAYAELASRLADHRADAVVCYQDYTALGLILELLNRGVRVPADVAVTGFDDLPIGQAYSIGVTTYAFSAETVAIHAIRLLRARAAGDLGPPVKVLVPGTLIVRGSSGGEG